MQKPFDKLYAKNINLFVSHKKELMPKKLQNQFLDCYPITIDSKAKKIASYYDNDEAISPILINQLRIM